MALYEVILFIAGVVLALTTQLVVTQDNGRSSKDGNPEVTVFPAKGLLLATATFPQVNNNADGITIIYAHPNQDGDSRQTLVSSPKSPPPLALLYPPKGVVSAQRTKRQVFTNTSTTLPLDSPVNDLMDFAINSVIYKQVRAHGFRFPLQDMVYEDVQLSNGYVGDIRKAYRAGPLRVRRVSVRNTRAVLLEFAVGVRQVDFTYDYKFKWGIIKKSGTVTGTLTPLVVAGRLIVQQPCYTRLLGLEISELGKLDLNGTGFGVLNNFMYQSVFKNRVANHVSGAVTKAMGDVKKMVQDELDTMSCLTLP